MSTRGLLLAWLWLALLADGCSALHSAPSRVGRPLTKPETSQVDAAIALMRHKGLTSWADQASSLEAKGFWKAALASDPYLAASEKAGDTPFAYTLPDDKHPHQPVEIVLAPRFFTDADTTAEAALMIHEMGHWRAYVATGKSTEYDGYKAEYDTHKQLGLSENDQLTYFAMLDGVAEYVVPRAPQYKNYPDVKNYMSQPG